MDWSGPHAFSGGTVSNTNQDFLIDTGATISALDDGGRNLRSAGAARITTAGGATQVFTSSGVTVEFEVKDTASGTTVLERYSGTFVNTSLSTQLNVLGMDILAGAGSRNLRLTVDGTVSNPSVTIER